MKKHFKILVSGLSIVLLSSIFLPVTNHSVFADSVVSKQDKNSNVILKIDGKTFNNVSVSEDIINASQILENYFYLDKFGNVNLKGTPEELAKNLGISITEAELMYQVTKELPNCYDRGYVGFKFILGPKIRSMSGWAAGTYATGYVGWYLKQFAVNPATAGNVALISGAVGWSIKTAIEKHWKVSNAIVYIPFVNFVYTVHLP